MNNNLKKIFENIPNSPGCYKYFDKNGRLIYIGKAKNLKKRVSSYFNKNHKDIKTPVLVENIADIKWETTGSEIEALILESLLIKKFKPKFNIKIKDDKDFLWVKIDMKQKFSMPELVRRQNIDKNGQTPPIRDGVRLFGPFTDAKLLREGLVVLRKIFLWRDCSAVKFSSYAKKGRPCLEYQIKNCSAPCCNFINDNDYHLGIKHLIRFFEGKKESIVRDMTREMMKLAKAKRFEEAGKVRDRIKALQHIGASLSLNQESRIKNQEFGVASPHIIKNLISILNAELGYDLKFKKDFRIEFYDISNTSGTEAVGSMVVSSGGQMAKDQYRKFKIKTVKGPNDFLMLREVLCRRIKNYELGIKNENHDSGSMIHNSNDDMRFRNKKDASFSQKPDLIVLDGGKPQLGEIAQLFGELKIDIPLLGLAKEEEEVFGVKSYKVVKSMKLNIAKNSPEGFFLQRIRDEAHRFAVTYHKNLRSKKTFKSRLDEIEGIGPVTKKKLLLKFGSVSGIIKASQRELENEVGKKLAKDLKEQL